MSGLVLTPAERALFEALNASGIRFLVVGMSAALLEGVPGTTQDIDLWLGRIDPVALAEAAQRAGGFYTSGFGVLPPTNGGGGLDRIDIVSTAAGLGTFDEEYAASARYDVEGGPLRVLPLSRVLASKRSANRPKVAAQIPILEATLAARQPSDPPELGRPGAYVFGGRGT